ncbi:exodeoxyribonuclease I [Pseudomonas sp. nanlin1]|uniref:exodeoxyribonuclease I n=1 Tax=Pseudomonas sp. nanlin1 TaxID=3040605 RepID=UPI00388F773E
MSSSIFWHDYETTGINPRSDRALQFAGIRTDAQLNEIDEPINLYCRLSDDILPHPAACLITGITPQTLDQQGLPEADFMARVHAQLAAPGTCGAGYNSLRFDDEVTRYSLYRNLFDPYAREWQGGNSRWDLIDGVRTAYALRPEGIVWPEHEGHVSLKLEGLTAANGIEHGQAHDALADVRATIALARLLSERQPKLYQWLYHMRIKQNVMEQVRLMQPRVHISGRFSAARHYLGVVLPLAWHPRNRNALIVCDLHEDPSPLFECSAEALRARLYQRREDRAPGELPVPLKLVHVNRCPVLAPMSVLRAEDYRRLQLDSQLYERRIAELTAHCAIWQEKLPALYADDGRLASQDPEQQLYDGFIGDRDRRLCERARTLDPADVAQETWMFDDGRLGELLFRYRARNFPDTLSESESARWLTFCKQRLTDETQGAPLTLLQFDQALAPLLAQAKPQELEVLKAWKNYVSSLKGRLDVAV